jgi:S-DNA-T family DNA segregation ATPase FtsK/SpoIIIE
MPAQPLLEDARRDAAIAIRIPVRLLGAILLAIAVVLLLSLASWKVDDSSFSFASDLPVRNWLGFPGAVIADIGFQVLGLGAVVLAVPPALWGWSLFRLRVPPRMGFRLIAWLIAVVMACGVFSFISVPASWPLPTGLGGLLGGAFTTLVILATGETPQKVTGLLFALITAAPALAVFWYALGLGRMTAGKAAKAKARRGAGRASADDEDDEEQGERSSVIDVLVGAAVHAGYATVSAFRRARADISARNAAMPAGAGHWRDSGTEPSLDRPGGSRRPTARTEPPMVADRRTVVDAADALDDDAVDLYPDESDDFEVEPPRWDMPTPSRGPMAIASEGTTRVAAPAPRPQQGRRAAREAQPSLLDDNFGFELPALGLLAAPKHKGVSPEHAPERLEAMARKLESVLDDFGVKGDIINVRPGPVVTLFELEPAPGIKSSRVISLADDIARSMSAISARVAVVPGRNAIGIELPNEHRETVYLREMLASSDFEKMRGKLPICLGKTIGGEPIIADLARMPHLLIAGTTGSGKSVGINTMILSLLYQMTPEQCRLIMVDPKMLELSIYDGIPHLLTPVVTDPHKAVTALKWAVREMEDRYRKMSKIGVRNIDGFNQRVTEAKGKGEVITRTVQTGFDRETGEAIFESEEFNLEPLPYIVVIVDEMADLMMVAGKDIEGAIQRLAQMARAAGIHMITATQRPSVDVITGTIKANFPTRISFQVTSKIDSRTILGEQGAEQLLGNGDMLYMAGGGRIRRLHGPFVSDAEVESVVAHLKAQGAPDYLESITAEDDEMEEGGFGDDGEFGGSGDELYDKAVNIVLQDKKASTSYIQRRLAVGYNKAASLIERMEREGVVSQANHAGKREILVGSTTDAY